MNSMDQFIYQQGLTEFGANGNIALKQSVMFMIKNLIRFLCGNSAPTFKDLRSMSGEEAKQLILQGRAPKDFTTEKPLIFNKN